MGIQMSMGSVGDAYDNAMAESFFASLECELIKRHSWPTRRDARLAVFTWIEPLSGSCPPETAVKL
jgi:putative transposase